VKELIVILLFVWGKSFGQNTISTSFNYTKTDFFHGIEYGRDVYTCSFFAGFEYGVNRTVFQSRFFPKAKGGVYYRALNKEKFNLGPVIQYSYAYLRYSKIPDGTVSYHELNGGLRWRYGQHWQIGQTLLIGGLWERGRSTIYQQPVTSGTLGFTLQIDCIYAF